MWAALRLFFLLSLFALPARGEQAWLLLSDNSAPYAEFESTLRDTLADSRWRLTVSHVAGSADAPRPQADLIIAAGAQASAPHIGTAAAGRRRPDLAVDREAPTRHRP